MLIRRTIVAFCILLIAGPPLPAAPDPKEEQNEDPATAAIEKLGGHLFRDAKTGEVVEVRLNRSAGLRDDHLAIVAKFTTLTDLSLEETAITGAGLAHLAGLKKLEWINLWNTQIDDPGMTILARLPALQSLPVGGTQITDAGLLPFKEHKTLRYLGLRNTAVTDSGVAHLAALPALTELNLRNTKVTDDCLSTLIGLRTLKKVWLGDTGVTKEGVARLRRMKPGCTVNLEK